MENSRLLVLVPAYNEQKNIGAIVEGIKQYLPENGDILVVNDGSLDNTKEEAEKAGAVVISLPFNLGYGVALKTGYKYAIKHNYFMVIQMDGDGQHDPSAIPLFIDNIKKGKTKVIIGSRYLGRNTLYRTSFSRRIGQRLFSYILSLLIGKYITDPTSGYQAIHHDVLKLYISEEFPSDFPDADILLLLHYKGFKFDEINVLFHQSKNNTSMHGGLKPIYYIYKMLLSIFLVSVRYKFKTNT